MMKQPHLLVCLLLCAARAAAFVPTLLQDCGSRNRMSVRSSSLVVVLSAKSRASKSNPKGFGTPKDESATVRAAEPSTGSTPPSFIPSNSATSTTMATSASLAQQQSTAPTNANPVVAAPITTSTTSSSSSSSSMTSGQRALAEMRRQKAEERDAELRKVRNMLDADRQVQETAASIPEQVSQRMLGRMLPFVGVPFVLGMTSFVGFWYMATYKNWELEPALVAASTIALLVSGLLGITYSLMSASWDPEREGSFWGWSEFTRNLDNIREGLGRSRENAVLRDKLTGLGEDEINRALADLERRDAAGTKKQQSLQGKLKDELES